MIINRKSLWGARYYLAFAGSLLALYIYAGSVGQRLWDTFGSNSATHRDRSYYHK